jgi:hypothetical protein
MHALYQQFEQARVQAEGDELDDDEPCHRFLMAPLAPKRYGALEQVVDGHTKQVGNP